MENRQCPSCGAPASGTKCEFCGTPIPEQKVVVNAPPPVASGNAAPFNDVQTHLGYAMGNTQYPAGYMPRSKTTALILAIFLGWIGAHRFYVGKSGTGLLMIVVVVCSLGLGWIWTLIDIIMIATDKFVDSNGYALSR
jgi:TM2 domain-containing membrane protein YozV